MSAPVKWERFERDGLLGYSAVDGRVEVTDNGGGMGPAAGSGRWAVTVDGRWVANIDLLTDAKARALTEAGVDPARATPPVKLTASQEDALRWIAEHGEGVRLNVNVVSALERRGLVGTRIWGAAYLTPEGTVQALALWRAKAAEREALRGSLDAYTADLIAKLEAEVN